MHRRLVGLGVSSVVVCPQNWDERNKKAKSDSLDGLALCQRLDRYVAGNRRALAVVSVPTIEQEIGRGRCRERETFKREVNRWAARGRSLLCQFGIDAAGRWWEPRRFEHLSRALHEHEHLSGDQAAMLVMMLQDYREMIEPLEKKLVELTRELRESRRQRADACVVEGVDEAEVADDAAALKCGDVPLPRGLGALTSAKLSREICDWSRFGNRRQVASYTGLCPGVYSSGEARREGPISRHGNPRVRAELIELAWRMWWYQKDYPPVQRWKRRLGEGASRPARKRAIVAIARRLAIDLWRVNTARSTWQKLHCVMQPAA
jgi:transposase